MNLKIYVAKYLGPKQLGILTFAISIAVVLRPFVKLGLESIAYRDLTDCLILDSQDITDVSSLSRLASGFF